MHPATCFHRQAADASRIAAAARVPAAGRAPGSANGAITAITAITAIAPALSAPRLSASLLLDLLIGCRA